MLEQWKILLDGDHTETVWEEITRLAEGLPAERLDVLRDDLRGWTGKRAMPERWWRESRRGDHHPWHALADHYVLWRPGIHLDDDDAAAAEDEPHLEHGVVTAAVSSDLRWLVVAGEREGDHGGGDAGLWDIDAGSWRPLLISGADHRFSAGTAYDVEFSPDGSLVAIGMNTGGDRVRLGVWRTGDSELLWSAGPGDEADPWRFDPRDGSEVVVAFSGDGRRLVGVDKVAADAGQGRVVVVEAETGDVLFSAGAHLHGPPVLDHTGERLAYLGQEGNLVVRAVPSGEVLVDRPVGESAAGPAFAPDGGTLAVGGEGAVALFHFGTAELERFEVSGERAAVRWTPQGLRVIHREGRRVTVTAGVDGEVLWSGRPEGLSSFTRAGTALITTRTGPNGGETAIWFLRAPETGI